MTNYSKRKRDDEGGRSGTRIGGEQERKVNENESSSGIGEMKGNGFAREKKNGVMLSA